MLQSQSCFWIQCLRLIKVLYLLTGIFLVEAFRLLKQNWFWVQVFMVWLVLCIPGNAFTLYLYYNSNITLESLEDITRLVPNISELSCHEAKNEWSDIITHSKFFTQGEINQHIFVTPVLNLLVIDWQKTGVRVRSLCYRLLIATSWTQKLTFLLHENEF